MSKPTTRDEFGQYCLRRLGAPVIDIEIAPEQLDDRIDDSLSKFFEYHFDGREEKYLVVTIQTADVIAGYIALADEIYAVDSILPLSTSSAAGLGTAMFSAQYQFYMSDLYNNQGILGGNLSEFDSMRSYMSTMQSVLVPMTSFNFNRKTNRIYFNESLAALKAKTPTLILSVYKQISVDDFPEVWNDEFLKDYATALIKKQWGSNIKKYGSLTLPGGITLNGQEIFTEAVEEITRLEEKLINDLQGPLFPSVG